MQAIFITGGTQGIGRATADLFIARGWIVGFCDLNQAAIDGMVSADTTSRLHGYQADVTQIDELQTALDQFAQVTGGKLDVLHNNAGLLHIGAFNTIDLNNHHQVVDVNINGCINALHVAYPLLKNTAQATVINMSSGSAMFGTPDFAVYSATKHAVRALTEALNVEWARDDIHVCDVMPPFVNTPMVTENHGSPLVDKMGVNIEAESIAQNIWKISNTKNSPVHTVVTIQMKIARFFFQRLPTRVLVRIFRAIAEY